MRREAVRLHAKGRSAWSHEALWLMEVLTLVFFRTAVASPEVYQQLCCLKRKSY